VQLARGVPIWEGPPSGLGSLWGSQVSSQPAGPPSEADSQPENVSPRLRLLAGLGSGSELEPEPGPRGPLRAP